MTTLYTSLVSAAVGDNWLGINNSALRNGDVSLASIPTAILNVTNFTLKFVGTVAMIMIIYGAIRM